MLDIYRKYRKSLLFSVFFETLSLPSCLSVCQYHCVCLCESGESCKSQVRDCMFWSTLRPCRCHVRLLKAAKNSSVPWRVLVAEAREVQPRARQHLSRVFALSATLTQQLYDDAIVQYISHSNWSESVSVVVCKYGMQVSANLGEFRDRHIWGNRLDYA